MIDGDFIIRKLYDVDFLHSGIKDLTESKSSVKTFFSTVRKIYYMFNEKIPDEIGVLMDKLTEDIIEDCKTFTPTETDGMKYLTDNVNRLESELGLAIQADPSKWNIQCFALFVLYTRTPPLRRDWHNVKIYDNIQEDTKENYIVRGSCTLYLNTYKNSHVHGSLVLDYNNYPDAGTVLTLLETHVKTGDYLFKTNKGKVYKGPNFSGMLQKLYGSTLVTTNLLRKWYCNQVTSQQEEDDKDKMDKFMAHGREATRDYYLKD